MSNFGLEMILITVFFAMMLTPGTLGAIAAKMVLGYQTTMEAQP